MAETLTDAELESMVAGLASLPAGHKVRVAAGRLLALARAARTGRRYKAALEPFAKYAARADKMSAVDESLLAVLPPDIQHEGTVISVGDLRRARAALEDADA